MANKKKRSFSEATLVLGIFLAEALLLALLFAPAFYVATAAVGENATTTTVLEIGNVFPEILDMEFDGGAQDIDLTPNATKQVIVTVIARDFNGEEDVANVTVELFDLSSSFVGDADDNNYHYTNNSCALNLDYGDIYELEANCTFDVWYYAYNSTWQATAVVTDSAGLTDSDNATAVVNKLLAVGVPDVIDYGTVNATFVSDEQIANVTNFGNVFLNLSLSGYSFSEGDGNAMNCTLGSVKNISIEYEKYNLTASTLGVTSSNFSDFYVNLSSTPTIKTFDLQLREDDVTHDAIKPSYWRIYVPVGVAGSCSGNILFGAVQGSGT